MPLKNYATETLDIYARSSSMFERKDGNWDYLSAKNSTEKRVQDITHWESVLSKKEGKKWLKRFLDIEAIDTKALDKMLSEVRVNARTVLPDWVAILESILEIYSDDHLALAEDTPFLEAGNPIPFEEILLPMVHLYRQLMDKELVPCKARVRTSVRTNFERSFLGLISRTMGKVLYEQFYYFRQIHLMTNQQQQVETGSREIYLAFVQSMKAGGLVDLLKKYPVLARIISVLTMQLPNVNARFINRFMADYTEIKQHFFQGQAIGKLNSVGTSVSDRHKGGDGVVILTFDNNEKLVYKPKNLGLAENYDKLVGWINQRSYQPDFKRFKTLNRSDYGWMEFLDFSSCTTKEDVEVYYLRAGSLLCLTHFLQTTDCHYENVIACGAYPTLVDFETILHPHVLPTYKEEKTTEELEILHKNLKSISRTGLLPMKIKVSNLDFNMGGFGSLQELKPTSSLGCLHPNTDEMNIAMVQFPPRKEIHIPHLEQQPQRVNQYLPTLKLGFQQMYTFLLTHQSLLKGANSPLNIFKNLPERFLFRNTYIYASILDKLQNPKYLKNGITYSIQLEMLTKAFLKPTKKPLFWEMVYEERRAMMEQDIPFYQTTTATKSLKIQEKYEVTDFFENSSYQSMMNYLEGLSQEDLDFQLTVIENQIGQSLETKETALKNSKAEKKEPLIVG